MARVLQPLNQTEIDILAYLWKWKLLTTATIQTTFYPNSSSNWTYKVLLRLEDQKLIESRSITRKIKVWAITQSGFRIVQESLPCGTLDIFKSEALYHDFLVTALQLGDQVDRTRNNLALFSEMQLRAYPLDFYPPWVPRSERHRPDGYSRVEIGFNTYTIALEIERFQKTDNFYEESARFYLEHEIVSRVLWVLGESSCESMHLKMLNSDVTDGMIHNFTTVDDFMSLGWNAPIRFGYEAGKSLRQLLSPNDSQSSHNCDRIVTLDTRKNPVRLISSLTSEASTESNRVAPYTLFTPRTSHHDQLILNPNRIPFSLQTTNQKQEVPNEH